MYRITIITTGDVEIVETIDDVVSYFLETYTDEEIINRKFLQYVIINIIKIFNQEIEWFETEEDGLLIERIEAE